MQKQVKPINLNEQNILSKKHSDLMKILLTIYCLLFISVGYSYAQDTPETITDKFFETYRKEGVDKGIDYMFSTNKYSSELKDGIDKVKLELINTVNRLEKFHGYELLSKINAGKSLILYTFLVKHDKDVLTFRILFYNPDKVWRVQTFKFDNSISDELEEASKPYGVSSAPNNQKL